MSKGNVQSGQVAHFLQNHRRARQTRSRPGNSLRPTAPASARRAPKTKRGGNGESDWPKRTARGPWAGAREGGMEHLSDDPPEAKTHASRLGDENRDAVHMCARPMQKQRASAIMQTLPSRWAARTQACGATRRMSWRLHAPVPFSRETIQNASYSISLFRISLFHVPDRSTRLVGL